MKQYIRHFDLTINHIQKSTSSFIALLSMIIISELIFLVRGLAVYDFSRTERKIIVIAYIFLILLAFSTLIAVLAFKKNDELKEMIYFFNQFFFVGVLIWSSCITAIDLGYNHLSMALVYAFVIMATSATMIIRPGFFTAAALISGIGITAIAYSISGRFLSVGFYSNYFITVVGGIIINRYCYKLHSDYYKSELKMIEASLYDSLTGIHNRRSLDKKMAELNEEGRLFVFVLLDIDDFKQINDRHGHLIGDESITMVARLIKEQFGENVFRYGGDEFAVISSYNTQSTFQKIEEINRQLSILQRNFPLHISAGIYDNTHNSDISEIFINTDFALYSAKAAGKCTAYIYK